MKIGVLALQGAFAEHIRALHEFPGIRGVEIRRRADFASDLAGVVIPGGESTVMAKLLAELDLLGPLSEAVEKGMPAFGTCAGLILLAREVENASFPRLGGLDVAVKRNAYGRQQDSFSARGDFAGLGEMDMVFIRAPALGRIGPGVETLAEVGGAPVAVRQGAVLATAFHPELTADRRVHRYFLSMIPR